MEATAIKVEPLSTDDNVTADVAMPADENLFAQQGDWSRMAWTPHQVAPVFPADIAGCLTVKQEGRQLSGCTVQTDDYMMYHYANYEMPVLSNYANHKTPVPSNYANHEMPVPIIPSHGDDYCAERTTLASNNPSRDCRYPRSNMLTASEPFQRVGSDELLKTESLESSMPSLRVDRPEDCFSSLRDDATPMTISSEPCVSSIEQATRQNHSFPICSETFSSSDALRAHATIHGRSETDRSTEHQHCQEEIRNQERCQDHAEGHSRERRFGCEECGTRFFSKKTLNEHIMIHTGERPFACEICGKAFRRKHDLKIHTFIHSKVKQFKCQDCLKTFAKFSALHKHKTVHSKQRRESNVTDRRQELAGCSSGQTDDYRNSNDDTPVTSNPSHVGDYAERTTLASNNPARVDCHYSRSDTLTQYQKVGSDELLKTESLDSSTPSLRVDRPEDSFCSLRDNTPMTISSEPCVSSTEQATDNGHKEPTQNHSCCETFASSDTLIRTHATIHARSGTDGSAEHEHCQEKIRNQERFEDRAEGYDRERPFGCEECGTRFFSKSKLNAHLMIHTGERPFACEVCGKAFRKRYDLKIHTFTHSKVKQFQCQDCHKTFAKFSVLHKHKAVHSKQRRESKGTESRQELPVYSSGQTDDSRYSNNDTPVTSNPSHGGNYAERTTLASNNPARVDCHYPSSDTLTQHQKVGSDELLKTESLDSSTPSLRVDRPEDSFCSLRDNTPMTISSEPCVSSTEQATDNGHEEPTQNHSCSETFASSDMLIRTHATIHARSETDGSTEHQHCQEEIRNQERCQDHAEGHSRERRFGCEECGTRFFSKKNLNEHIMIHTGERPFACEICGKAFRRKHDLKIHTFIHSQVKKFKCQDCLKTFVKFSALHKHRVVHVKQRRESKETESRQDQADHTGSKRPDSPDDQLLHRSCSMCSQSFPNVDSLHAHEKNHASSQSSKTLVCRICSQTFMKEKSFEKHLQQHKLDGMFCCDICAATFNTKHVLLRHMSVHSGNKPFKCSTCDKSYRRNSDLKEHMAVHTRVYTCKQCAVSFPTIADLRTHRAGHSYECATCKKVFTRKDHLADHTLIHTRVKQFKCRKCPQRFLELPVLEEHRQMHYKEKLLWSREDNIKKHECKVCHQRFDKESCLKQHAFKHAEEKPWSCSLCGKRFLYQKTLRQHKLSHTGRRDYKCQICADCAFFHPDGLKMHMKQIHNDDHDLKLFACGLCDRRYAFKGSLKAHMRIHTGEKPFTCKACHLSFHYYSTLHSHRQTTHSDKLPFICETCGKGFKTVYYMRRHQKNSTHNNDRSHLCQVCGKTFTSGSRLSRHLAIHSEHKPFVCHVCGKSCKRKDNLRTHMKVHDPSRRKKEEPTEHDSV